MAKPARLKPATILIVENEALIRNELADWLGELGLAVLVARDADEAITLLERHPEIDVLMTDIAMPGSMDGLRLAHHVSKRWPPITIVVASGRLHTQRSELPAGSLFVPKPFEPDGLWRTLAGTLANRRVQPPTLRAS
jgi:CheY-like chemotaxis protein